MYGQNPLQLLGYTIEYWILLQYAGTANRNLCKEMDIQTSFVKRSRTTTEKMTMTRTIKHHTGLYKKN